MFYPIIAFSITCKLYRKLVFSGFYIYVFNFRAISTYCISHCMFWVFIICNVTIYWIKMNLVSWVYLDNIKEALYHYTMIRLSLKEKKWDMKTIDHWRKKETHRNREQRTWTCMLIITLKYISKAQLVAIGFTYDFLGFMEKRTENDMHTLYHTFNLSYTYDHFSW